MKNLEFLPGTEINTIGKVQRLHFTDLFEANYIIDEDVYTQEDIVDEVLARKEVITEKLFNLLQKNKDFAFKFMTKMALKTQNIPLINSLNGKVEHLEKLINKEYFTWASYSNYSEAKTYLKKFLFSYYTKTID